MRIVLNDKPTYVRVSSVSDGHAFKRKGQFYIRPCRYIRASASVEGINLETGDHIDLVRDDLVEPVDLEVHEL